MAGMLAITRESDGPFFRENCTIERLYYYTYALLFILLSHVKSFINGPVMHFAQSFISNCYKSEFNVTSHK